MTPEGRRATVLFAVLVAALLLLLVVGLVVVDGLRPAAPLVPDGDRPPAPKPARTVEAATPVTDLPADPESEPERDSSPLFNADERPEPDPPDADTVAGRVVTAEGDWPIPGVRLLDVERFEGHWIPRLDGAVNDGAVSDGAGAVALRRPVEGPLAVLVRTPEGVEVEAVEGGTLEEDHDGRPVMVVLPATKSFCIVLSDSEGEAFLRLVEPDGSGPVPADLEVRQRWLWGHAEPWVETVALLRPDAAGWRRVHRPSEPPMRADAPLPAVALEVFAPGREIVRIPAADVRGRREVVLPLPVAPVTGEVRAPAGTETFGVALHLRARDGGPSGPPFRGAPGEPGPFTLLDVPDGAWTLEATAMTAGGVLQAEVDFDKRGGAVDVGVVVLAAGARARVRIVDTLDRPVPGTLLRIDREEEASVSRSMQLRPTFRRGETLLFENGRLVGVMLRAPGSEAVDAAGWWTFDGLRPGQRYRVTASDFAGVERVFTAPPAGDTVDVELRWEGRLVECVLVLSTKTRAPNWERVTVSGPTLAAARPDAAGVLRVHLAAGEHDLMAVEEAGPADGPRLFILRGEVTVPEGRESFTADVELR